MSTISSQEALDFVSIWNARVNDFMDIILPELLKAEGIATKDNSISLNDWFRAQEIVRQQNFYEIGKVLQTRLRNAGHDVKMSMLDHTLFLE